MQAVSSPSSSSPAPSSGLRRMPPLPHPSEVSALPRLPGKVWHGWLQCHPWAT